MIRLLLADDEVLIRGALAALLSLEDDLTVVAEAASGTAAVAAAVREAPDLAVLDLEMPPGDGVSAAAEIHERLGVPVVLVTRHARPAVLRRALAAGPDGDRADGERQDVELAKELGETVVAGQTSIDRPAWHWPAR